MVFRQAATVKPEWCVLFYRHIVLHLFHYLLFRPL